MFTKEQIVENRGKWAEALESGKYPQCHGVMRSGKGYCCLGVAAVITGQKPVGASSIEMDHYNVAIYEHVDAVMGLTGEQRSKFTSANDYGGKSFKEIAKMVRDLPPPQ